MFSKLGTFCALVLCSLIVFIRADRPASIAQIETYPFIVNIFYKNGENMEDYDGILVTYKWVLTAQLCGSIAKEYQTTSLRVAAGSSTALQGELRNVSKILLSGTHPSKEIALIEVVKPFPEKNTIKIADISSHRGFAYSDTCHSVELVYFSKSNKLSCVKGIPASRKSCGQQASEFPTICSKADAVCEPLLGSPVLCENKVIAVVAHEQESGGCVESTEQYVVLEEFRKFIEETTTTNLHVHESTPHQPEPDEIDIPEHSDHTTEKGNTNRAQNSHLNSVLLSAVAILVLKNVRL